MLQTIVSDKRKDSPRNKYGFKNLLLHAEKIVHNFEEVILGSYVQKITYSNDSIRVGTKYFKKDFDNNKAGFYCKAMKDCLNNLKMVIVREEHACKEKCETIYSEYVLKRV